MLDVKGHEQPPQGARTYKHPGARRALIRPAGAGLRGLDRLRRPRQRRGQPDRRRAVRLPARVGVVVANIMAVLIQYQSRPSSASSPARACPEMLGERHRQPLGPPRLLAAGRARGRRPPTSPRSSAARSRSTCCSACPSLWGGLIVGAVSMRPARGAGPGEAAALRIHHHVPARHHHHRIHSSALFISPPDPRAALAGLVPGFQGPDTVLLAAQHARRRPIMPHAIYVHSALSRDRHRPERTRACPAVRRRPPGPGHPLRRRGRAGHRRSRERRHAAPGRLPRSAAKQGTDTIEGAHAAISANLGPVVGVRFAVRTPRVRAGVHLGGLLCRRHHHAGTAQDPDPGHGPPGGHPDSGSGAAGAWVSTLLGR